ncbi:hypothetical protein C427_3946 [Paraglaciecola psychrophila 170]|uniref:Uncharacterized protein n=1 Tax=Paraglaciecola psychrophila 170 TaxID=1129794 RepID=M4RR46_9ALTE|nr:hypothetical protein C427_3946 [Paraglaciecola psychrophila 170]
MCEGATEVGFLRGFDDYQVENKKDPFSFHGVAILNAGAGSKVKKKLKRHPFLGSSKSPVMS